MRRTANCSPCPLLLTLVTSARREREEFVTQAATRAAAPPGVPTGVLVAPAAPSPAPALLEAIRDLPGLAHARLVDAVGGHVLAEIGADDDTTGPVLAWGRRALTVASDRGLALDDLIVT